MCVAGDVTLKRGEGLAGRVKKRALSREESLKLF